MYYLITYDITSPKRISKVANILSNYGTRIQYSVLEAEILTSQFEELKRRIDAVIDETTDGVK